MSLLNLTQRIVDVIHLQDISLNSAMCGYSLHVIIFSFLKNNFAAEICSQTIIV